MRFALVRHDAAIAAALARQVARRWRDLLTVLIVLPILALFARAWLAELPVERREIITGIAGFLIAAAVAKTLMSRIAYHRTDGVIAHFAQRSADALCYIPLLLAGGLAVLFAGLFAVTGLASVGPAIGMGAGVAVGMLAAFSGDRFGPSTIGLAPGRARAFQQRHGLAIGAVVSGTAGLVCALLPSANHLDAIVAGGYALAVVILTGQVDATAVRYMAMVGNSSMELLRKWLPLPIVLLVPAAAVLALSQSWVAASVTAVAAAGLPAITILRIFAYRAFSRVLADWLVTILIAVAAYLTFSFPPLGPLAIVAAILWLAWRGRDARWLVP
ncbi:MAG: hypothetical protein GW855_04505 [Erythrobacter sp.]|nr:hypothetical protein [Erythrobacter sp.]NCQ62568.1 hypothetical protein [Alphaproteobacteria bacterium]